MDSKTCVQCGIEKPESDFQYRRDARRRSGFRDCSECRDCFRQAERLYNQRASEPQAPLDEVPLQDAGGLRVCPRCMVLKPHSDYGPARNRRDGVQVYCRVCTRARYEEEREPTVVDGVTHLFCRTCRTRKPESEMTVAYRFKCKACWAIYMREWYDRSLGRAMRARALQMPEDGLIAMTCSKCKVFRPIADFYYRGKRHLRKCGYCYRTDGLAYYAENRQAIHDRARDRRYRRNYGMTLEDKLAMIEAQNGRCAICQDPLDDPRKTHIDHCHADGRVRGILCMYCNQAIGGFRDDPERMSRAIDYVTRLA